MQFARKVSALVFPDLLQMGGQFSQCCGALTHLLVQLIALPLQGSLLAAASIQQRPGLPQVHVKRQQSRQRHQRNADAGQLKGPGDLCTSLCHLAVVGVNQPQALFADGVHLVHAHVCRQHKLPRLLVALLAHANAEFHLGQLARDATGQQVKFREIVWVWGVKPPQGLHCLGDVCCRAIVWLQVFPVPCQQIATLPRFRVEHLL